MDKVALSSGKVAAAVGQLDKAHTRVNVQASFFEKLFEELNVQPVWTIAQKCTITSYSDSSS